MKAYGSNNPTITDTKMKRGVILTFFILFLRVVLQVFNEASYFLKFYVCSFTSKRHLHQNNTIALNELSPAKRI